MYKKDKSKLFQNAKSTEMKFHSVKTYRSSFFHAKMIDLFFSQKNVRVYTFSMQKRQFYTLKNI